MKRLLFILPVGIFLVLTLYFSVGLQRDPGYLPSMLIDREVPSFSLSTNVDGVDALSSEDFSGRVALLNVFGSWCVGCTLEHPLLMEISSLKVVDLYGLNWRDNSEALNRWLKKNGNPYQRIGEDVSGRTAIDFGVTGAPETFVIDASGRVRYKHIGPITPEVWQDILAPMIKDLENASVRS